MATPDDSAKWHSTPKSNTFVDVAVSVPPGAARARRATARGRARWVDGASLARAAAEHLLAAAHFRRARIRCIATLDDLPPVGAPRHSHARALRRATWSRRHGPLPRGSAASARIDDRGTPRRQYRQRARRDRSGLLRGVGVQPLQAAQHRGGQVVSGTSPPTTAASTSRTGTRFTSRTCRTCSSIRTINDDISSWNTASVTTMQACSRRGAFNQPIGSWNTASVTSMNLMFNEARAFNQDLSSWNINSVTT